MIFSPSFVGFPAMFISESAPDEPARIIAGQITCPQGTQTLFDFFCTRSRLPIVHNIFKFSLDLLFPLLSLTGFVLGSSE